MKKNFLENSFIKKKAQVPEGVMILAVLAICIASIYYAIIFQGKAVSALTIENASQIYNEQKKFEFYAEDAANLAMQKAYSEIAKFPSGSECGKFGELSIWTDGCPTNSEIERSFIKIFNDSLNSYGIEGKNIAISDKIAVSFKEKYSEIKELNQFMYYKLNYSYVPQVYISRPNLDFEKIYSEAKSKKAECDSRFSTNTEADKDIKIGRCIEELRLDDWNAAVTSSGNYYSFTLNSKKSYFYNNSFQQVKLRFLIKKT